MHKWFVWLIVPALLLAGCSDEGGSGDAPAAEEDPTGALVAAFEATAAAEAQTMTITLQSTPESLAAASEGDPLPPEAVEIILGSSVVVTGTKGDDPADQAASVTVEVPGTEGAEVIIAGTDLYLRADVRGLAEAFGQDTAMIDAFLQSPAAQQAPFLQSAANGEFIKIEGTDELAGNTGGTQQLAQQQEQIIREFGEAIKADAEVTSEGEDDVGDHLLVSIPFDALYRRVTDLAGQLGTGLPPGSVPPETEVPDGNFEMDVWVSDGRVAQIEVDFVRLNEEAQGDMPEGVEELALRIALSDEAEEITPPEGAVTVTGEEIMSLIFGGAFGGGELPGGDLPTEAPVTEDPPAGGGDIDCSVYEGLPPETFDGLPPNILNELEKLCPEVVN